ncbi:hypothetical protein KDW46_02200 [Burkholderia vietnamiensis]|nr:hypothetical protein [Burkholderia vietnamiensis]
MDEREFEAWAKSTFGFWIDNDPPRVLSYVDGGCHPASTEEVAMWDALIAGRRTTPDREAWQPIETAPKDGTPLVMFARYIHATTSIVVVAAWLETYGMWVNQSFSGAPIQQVVPSHWMPRPEFPTSDKGGA